MSGAPVPFVVVGGGPAGATIARLLRARRLPVLMIAPRRDPLARLEMVSPNAVSAFRAADLAWLLEDRRIAVPCTGIQRSAAGGYDVEDFLRTPGGKAFVVDRGRLDAELLRQAIVAGAERDTARVTRIRRHTVGLELTVSGASGERRMAAGVVIDATGRSAAVARRLGARRTCFQKLLAERAGSPHARGSTLDFRAESDNWSYSLSGPDGQSQTWRVQPGEPVRLRRTLPGEAADASSACVSPAAGDGWIAIGDACASFDPICGQGLDHAISTAIVAAGIVLGKATSRPDAAAAYSAACHATAMRSEDLRRSHYERA